MEKIIYEFELESVSETLNEYFTETSLLFDIECLGLSPKKSAVYLIGMAYRKETHVKLIQLFANSISDEYELLMEFEDILQGFDTVISFNGTRFDQPFIIERLKRQGEKSILPCLNHMDLYYGSIKCKDLLGLSNHKQKTLEEFLGLYREDIYDGGQLIDVYFDYINSGSDELKHLLLLHNFEDVKGMITVIEIMSYVRLKEAIISDVKLEADQDKIRIYGLLNITVPKSISRMTENYILIITDNHISCTFSKVSSSLNTYLKDYKNYVYLPDEDIIVPKQLAGSISSEQKVPCTRENCKISTEADFIRLPKSIKFDDSVRIFKENYLEKQTYIRCEDFNEDLAVYILRYILRH